MLLELADDGFQPVIVRFGTIYGLSGRTCFDLVVNVLAVKAVVEGEITVFGGDQWRSFLHVADAAHADSLLLTMDLPEAQAPFIFNVGSNRENYTIAEISEFVHKQVPQALLSHLDTNSDKRQYHVKFGKIECATGFKAEWTISEGIKQVVELTASGRISNYLDAAYSNHIFLRELGRALLARPRTFWAQELIRESVTAEQQSLSAG